jgi:hypothetical protein
MSPEPTDVVLSSSVVSFDGRVLELFGHAGRTGNRIHVAQITAVVVDNDRIVIT